MSPLHVVFDLDDTLYPERDFAIGGFQAASRWLSKTHGLALDVERMIVLLDAGHLGGLFKIVLAEVMPQYGPDVLKGLLQSYSSYEPRLALFADAADALARLDGRLCMGLITDGHAKTQQKKIAALGIASIFDHIVLTGALGPDRLYHKPHPRSFVEIEAALGAPGDRFVYVGDNPAKDFLAPNARGWLTIEIDRPTTRTTRIHKNAVIPEGGAPQLRLNTLADLPKLLIERI